MNMYIRCLVPVLKTVIGPLPACEIGSDAVSRHFIDEFSLKNTQWATKTSPFIFNITDCTSYRTRLQA